MSYQKNPPWIQKNVPVANFQQQMSIQQLQQLGFNTAFQQQQQQQFHHNQIHLPIQQYPANARVNTMAFQQQQPQPTISQQNSQASQQSTSSNQSKYNANLKVFSGTGIVSKIQNDIGFIDDEVLFHKNVCVKGLSPKLGDRVLVEAAYNQNMPFKWNATRVQVLPRANTSSTSNSVDNKSYSQHETSNDSYRNRRYSPERDRRNERRPRSRDNRDNDNSIVPEDNDRKRRRDERERPRIRESVEIRDRTKSPIRRPSPKRRRAHNIPRYMVQIPKICLALSNLDVFEVKRRYPNLYIPSDFTSHENKWMNVFPMHKPFSIQKPCSFHIMKDVTPVDETIAECVLDPSDADYSWSAKVMLLSMPAISDIYKKCIVRAEDSDKHDDADFIHPSRLINFLVGVRGKNETMAIGGPWSKKLDGENPENDPSVLIRTAIRTCKGLTGIDLSKCTQWYRFVELKYRRTEQNKKEGDSGSTIKPARIETVVIFLPDVHSCMPNRSEWEGVQQQYKQALEKLLTADNDPVPEEDEEIIEKVDSVVAASDEIIDIAAPSEISAKTDENSTTTALGDKDEKETDSKTEDISDGKDLSIDGEASEVKSDEIELDPSTMKVTELRAELSARSLSTKGLKNELVERLQQALNPDSMETDNAEKADEKAEEMQVEEQDENVEKTNIEDDNLQKDQDMDMNIAEMDMSEVTVIDEYDSTKCDEQEEKVSQKKKLEPKKMDEKEKAMWEKRYVLPDSPHIVVHPSKTARNGKFDCTVVSLSLLLDYRKDDTKEHSFEIGLFAEAFNEMLMRDFGFNIYKSFNVLSINNKPKEVKDDEKKSDDAENEKSNDTSENPEESKDKDKKDKSKRSGTDKRHEDSDDQSDHSRRRVVEKERAIKQITAFPDLLLSFNYFDQTQCGYIFEKDIEDLFYCLGINLARSQIRKLTEKFITRDSLYYRKLTDRQADAPVSNPFESLTEEQLLTMVQGNRPQASQNTEVVTQSNEIVTFEGTTVNLRQIIYQMKRIETAYEESEKSLVDLRKNNSDLKSSNHKNEKRIKDLSADLKSVSRKLQDTESNLNSVTRKYNECFSTIQTINERIAPVIARNERSRDRENRKSEKLDKSDSKKEKPKDEAVKSTTSDSKLSTSESKVATKEDKTVKAEKVEIKEEQSNAEKSDDKKTDAKIVEESL
ncbi:hypothetical protein ACKWTF_011834 [Chironomus riparius]